jgi:hypothetical protein
MPDLLIPNVRFIDIKAREITAQDALRIDLSKLRARQTKNGGLSDPDALELKRLERLDATRKTTPAQYYDPLFVATRAAIASKDSGLRPIGIEHSNGVLSFSALDEKREDDDAAEAEVAAAAAAGTEVRESAAAKRRREARKDQEIARTALVLGLLQLNKAPLPQIKANSKGDLVVPDYDHPNAARFEEALFAAVGRIAGRMDLAKRVLKLLAEAVDVAGDRSEPGVSSLEFATVFEKLVNEGVTATDPNLRRRVETGLNRVQEVGEERPLHEFEINIPDLEATAEFAVEGDHCRLMGSFICASAFEELKAFQVVDKLIELSQRGELPLIRGAAGTQLYNYWREAPNRMSENERQTFYAMTLGLPTGQPGVAVNSDFQDLWLRFVSSVSTLVRESRVDQLLRSALPIAVNQQQVKKAARDLAINMSSRGYGMVFYAAVDLQKQINEMIALLQDSELRAAFGARDMWGVIDQIAQTELGGARNSSKYRMLATSGAIITTWMANHIDRLRDPTLPMIEMREVENPPSRLSGQSAISHPTDYDLVNACEMWLADSAMGEEHIDQMSQPRESPQQTSRPIQIPSIARDLLEGAGLGLGMGLGGQRAYAHGNGNAGYAGY